MRAVLALLVLLLSASLAGCLERRGTLAIDLLVSDAGALDEFSAIDIRIDLIRLDARTLNPEDFPSAVQRIELVSTAAQGRPLELFRQEVRADRYDQVTLTVPRSATFRGTLLDGTEVAVVVPDQALVQTPSFEVPRGGEVTFQFVVRVDKVQSGQGSATYLLVPDAEASRVV